MPKKQTKKAKKKNPLTRGLQVMEEGDRKGGFVGEFNTLGKVKTRNGRL